MHNTRFVGVPTEHTRRGVFLSIGRSTRREGCLDIVSVVSKGIIPKRFGTASVSKTLKWHVIIISSPFELPRGEPNLGGDATYSSDDFSIGKLKWNLVFRILTDFISHFLCERVRHVVHVRARIVPGHNFFGSIGKFKYYGEPLTECFGSFSFIRTIGNAICNRTFWAAR